MKIPAATLSDYLGICLSPIAHNLTITIISHVLVFSIRFIRIPTINSTSLCTDTETQIYDFQSTMQPRQLLHPKRSHLERAQPENAVIRWRASKTPNLSTHFNIFDNEVIEDNRVTVGTCSESQAGQVERQSKRC